MNPIPAKNDLQLSTRTGDAAWQASLLLLTPGMVDLWVAPMQQLCEVELARQFDTVLSEEERRRHAKFIFEKDRRRYLFTRAMLRNVLSRYRHVHPADWQFAVTAFGRPFITNERSDVRSLNFNLSHSDQTVVIGVSYDRQLGVDVEDLRPSVPIAIADHFFAANEVRQLHGLPFEARPQRFLEFWTLKESYIKARGQGLALPLDRFGFDLTAPESLRFHAETNIDDRPERWAFWQWRPSAYNIAALCVERRPGTATSVKVRRASLNGPAEDMAFDVTRTSGA